MDRQDKILAVVCVVIGLAAFGLCWWGVAHYLINQGVSR